MENIQQNLAGELLGYFLKEGFQIIGAKSLKNYQNPPFLYNDGYGDQKSRMPEILAFDPKEKRFVIGAVRASREELDSEESLTEYNVFLDQKDEKTGTPFRLCLIMPASCTSEMTSLLTHYIHREYWYRITIVASSQC